MGKGVDVIRKNFWPILLTNYQFWPLVNYFNFNYIPLDYRMLAINICGVIWNTYLSWKSNQKSI
jgi:protein Mpv17